MGRSGFAVPCLSPFFRHGGLRMVSLPAIDARGNGLAGSRLLAGVAGSVCVDFSRSLSSGLMKFLPLSGLYPPPLKDPILENPAWGLMTEVLAGALVVGIGLHFLARYLTHGQPRSFDASKTLLMTLLLIVVVIALLYNPYWAVTFLTFPALLWGAVGQAECR